MIKFDDYQDVMIADPSLPWYMQTGYIFIRDGSDYLVMLDSKEYAPWVSWDQIVPILD